jgi:molybdopterin/thiamine biosynthesis adenylyltransferase
MNLKPLFFSQAAECKEPISRTIDTASDSNGPWVYFPWSGNLIHILSEGEFFRLRTNRNRNIITEEEQDKLNDFNVGVVGLSIGSNVAINLAQSGISKNMKLADADALELSNLNRMRGTIADIGSPKISIVAKEIYEINPYADLILFSQGLNQTNLNEFMADPKPRVIFELIDDFEMKIRVRQAAKQAGIPVIMLTNLGDRLMVDVERYDENPHLEIFNGLIDKTAEEILTKGVSEADKQKYAIAIVGKENIPQKVFDSVMEVGKSLQGRPQVLSTVALGSGLASYLVRRMALGESLPSGRMLFDFESLILERNG